MEIGVVTHENMLYNHDVATKRKRLDEKNVAPRTTIMKQWVYM